MAFYKVEQMGSVSELLWGCTIRIGWFWFLCLWKETNDGCSACMWLNVDGVSVLYAECSCAGFGWIGVDCDSLFLSPLSDDVKFMESAGLPKL